MRNFIWMLCGFALAGMLAGNLAACSAPPPEDGGETGDDGPGAASVLSGEARQAYAALLRQVCAVQTLPDGTVLEHYEESSGDLVGLELNRFALCDVDGDGQEELLLRWVNAGLANMMELVYGYDAASGEVREELREFPGITYYAGGAAEAPWSHNQGLGGSFWPYNLYCFRPEADAYEMTGAVDAWDRTLRDTDYQGNPFPQDLDADGDGLVYYLLPANGEDWTEAYDAPGADGPAYEAWRDACIRGAKALEPSFTPLTEENIQKVLVPPAEGAEPPAGGDAAEKTEDPAGPAEDRSAAPDSEEAVRPAGDQPYGRPEGFDKGALPSAFARAIEEYCQTGRLPDGEDSGGIPSNISYAVLDVDGDGRDELILQNTNTAMAGQIEGIYDYDEGSGQFLRQFAAFPALTYYDNGVIQADWSHNQGKAGDRLWPYDLYRYRPDGDDYELLGSVDAWDRELGEFYSAVGGGFPEETDADGDGYVYFLLPAGWEGQYTRGSLVDGSDYENWRSHYLAGAKVLEIPYQTLAVETVFPNAAG